MHGNRYSVLPRPRRPGRLKTSLLILGLKSNSSIILHEGAPKSAPLMPPALQRRRSTGDFSHGSQTQQAHRPRVRPRRLHRRHLRRPRQPQAHAHHGHGPRRSAHDDLRSRQLALRRRRHPGSRAHGTPSEAGRALRHRGRLRHDHLRRSFQASLHAQGRHGRRIHLRRAHHRDGRLRHVPRS